MRCKTRLNRVLGLLLLTTSLAACGKVNHGSLDAASTAPGPSAAGNTTSTTAPSAGPVDADSPSVGGPSQYDVFLPDPSCLGPLGVSCQVTIIQFKLADGTLLLDSKALSWAISGSHLNDMLQTETQLYQIIFKVKSVTYWVLSGQDVMHLAGENDLLFMLYDQRDLLNKVRSQVPGQNFVVAP